MKKKNDKWFNTIYYMKNRQGQWRKISLRVGGRENISKHAEYRCMVRPNREIFTQIATPTLPVIEGLQIFTYMYARHLSVAIEQWIIFK